MQVLEKTVQGQDCEIVFLTQAANAKPPDSLIEHDVRTIPFAGARQLRKIAPITIVDARDPHQLNAWKEIARLFARKSSPDQFHRLVLLLAGNRDIDPADARSLIAPFARTDCVEFSFDDAIGGLIDSIHLKWRILAHQDMIHADAPRPAAPRPSPLDGVKAIIASSRALRTAGGKLSADMIAKLYGISISKLAQWIGRSRQAMAKTPDADSLQNHLGYFERVARLRTVTSDTGFRKWLRIPNAQLDGARPLDLMAGDERQIVVDLVDDILTGSPT